MKQPYGVAAYPKSFRGTVVSKGKICIQFNDPQLKLRLLGSKGEMLPKNPLNHSRMLQIPETGIDVDVLAVGCPLNVIKELRNMIDQALEVHKQRFENAKED